MSKLMEFSYGLAQLDLVALKISVLIESAWNLAVQVGGRLANLGAISCQG